MTTFFIISGLVALVAFVLWMKARSDRKAGRVEERLKNTQEDLNNAIDENERLAARPRTVADVTNLLQRWREHLRHK